MNDDRSTGSRSTSYDKLTDELDKKMLNFTLKMTGLLATLIVKPLALATDVFFRKDFGERFLTGNSLVVSWFLWAAASHTSSIWGGQENLTVQWLWKHGFHKIAQWLIDHDYSVTIGWFMIMASGFMGGRSLFYTRTRAATGQMWYSLSRGASIFGNENKLRDIIIAAVAVGILSLFSPGLALLFAVSRIVSYQMEARQQSAFYNRYLDAMDAKIQAEYLQRALDKGEPPVNTEGLYCPLPKGFKGEHRQRVARVVAGGPFNPSATQDRPQPPQSFPPPRGGEPAPAAVVLPKEVAMQSALQDARNTAAETLASILKSKRIIRFAVVGLILLAVVAVATPVARFIHAQMSRPAAVAAAAPAQPTKPIPAALPVVAPNTKSAAEISNSAALAQAALDAQKRQEAEKQAALEAQKREEQAKAAAALEAQKRQEAERLAALELQKQQEKERAAALELQKQQETARVVEQVKTALADQEAQRAKLLADCETRLANNTNKIAKVATASRKTLQQNNDVLKEKIETALKTEDDSFKHMEGLLPPLAPNPQPDPRLIGVELTNYMAKVEKVRQQLTGMLADQDTDISNAPPQRGLLDFLIKTK